MLQSDSGSNFLACLSYDVVIFITDSVTIESVV